MISVKRKRAVLSIYFGLFLVLWYIREEEKKTSVYSRVWLFFSWSKNKNKKKQGVCACTQNGIHRPLLKICWLRGFYYCCVFVCPMVITLVNSRCNISILLPKRKCRPKHSTALQDVSTPCRQLIGKCYTVTHPYIAYLPLHKTISEKKREKVTGGDNIWRKISRELLQE